MELQKNAITVRQLNSYVKSIIDGDVRLACVSVIGELSNFKNHYSSGHWYFTLKDNDAAIKCVMFRVNASRVTFNPQDGMQVVLNGRASIYEKDGQFQFYAEEMLPYGVGDIAVQFELIKQKLADEGLFETANKRPLPKHPKCIGVVTSETGAAVQDILNILSRRYPVAEIIMCPVSVQGENAVPQMLKALDELYCLSAPDVIIIGRGGGSIEDLWAFNDEKVARKIYESPVPVISAVGHETDFTICDFVADLRAATPSAAAELAVPDKYELTGRLNKFESILSNCLMGNLNYSGSRLENLISSPVFKRPEETFILNREQYLDRIGEKAAVKFDNILSFKLNSFEKLISRLDNLSPLKIMSRGYSVCLKDNNSVKSVDELKSGDNIDIKFSDGTAVCTVEQANKEKK